MPVFFFFFFQAEDGIRDSSVTGVQTCALPISTIDDTLRHRQYQEAAYRHADAEGDQAWRFSIVESASSSVMTAAYFCCMSKRFASCGPIARSPTQSETTSGRKPCDIASTTLARTHPLVTAPATINVCTARCDNHGASCVPKNADGTVLRTTSSPRAGVSSGTIALFGWSSVSVAMPGTFSEKTLSSLPSAAYTMRLCATGQPC